MPKRLSNQFQNISIQAESPREIDEYGAKTHAQSWIQNNPEATRTEFIGFARQELNLSSKTAIFLWLLLMGAQMVQGQSHTTPIMNQSIYGLFPDPEYTADAVQSFDTNYMFYNAASTTPAFERGLELPHETSFTQSLSTNPLFEQATLGSEFTFFKEGLQNQHYDLPGNVIRNPATEQAQEQLTQKIMTECEPCTVEVEINKYGAFSYNITHPDGFWINIDTDPSCVETQMKPMSLIDYEQNADEIQRLLFDGAASLGLKPDSERGYRNRIPFRMGGGHIHFGLHSTFADATHLLNFEIDQQNNPFLGTGALGNYPRNAAPLAAQTDMQRNTFAKIVENFDAFQQDTSMEQLAERLNGEVFFRSLDPQSSPGAKYQQASLAHATSDTPAHARTVEFRAPGPERSVAHFNQLARLMLKRIDMLQSAGGVLEYEKPVFDKCDWDESSGCLFRFTSDREQAVVDGFYRFITEMGESWEEHRNLLDPVLNHKIEQGQLHAPTRPDNPEMAQPTAFAEAISKK